METINSTTRRGLVIGGIVLAVFIFFNVCFVRCTRVDSSEVGIKFNKLSLSEQGTLKASPVTGYVFYCPITTAVHTYPTFVQRVDYKPFEVNTKDAAIFTMDPTLAYYLDRSRLRTSSSSTAPTSKTSKQATSARSSMTLIVCRLTTTRPTN